MLRDGASAADYYTANLTAAVDRLEKLLPHRSVWPTEFAAELIRQSLTIASIVTQDALDTIQRGGIPQEAAHAVAEVGRLVLDAEEPLAKAARAVANARGPEVEIPDLRADVLRLLRTVVVAWRELWRLFQARPVFLRFSRAAARQLTVAMGVIDRAGAGFLELPVPPFPKPPGPIDVPAPVPVSRAARWGVLTLFALSTGGVLALGHRYFNRRA